MEKIYMENNNGNKKASFTRFIKKNGMLITTFMLAVAVIVTVILVGFNQVSYAIPDVNYTLGDTIVTAAPGEEIHSNSGFSVFPYKTTTGTHIYCLEHSVDYQANTTLTKSDAISDYGLLYLMAHIDPNVSLKDSSGNVLNENLQIWISQVAIWMYKDQLSSEELTKIQNAQYVYVGDDFTTTYEADIYNIVSRLVNSARNNTTEPALTLSVTRASEKISITSDENYYQTDLISVVGSPNDNFDGFKLEFVSAPEGTVVVDEAGGVIADVSNLSPDTKFYVRVPVEKITEENKVLKLSVTGAFKTYEGYEYTAEGAQTVTSVQTVSTTLNKGLEIELNYTPDTPNTGMSVAQTIYFIGLIVLLSGVGIIYANVKPAESK